MSQTIGQMYLTCAWLEAIFYGFNCILFGFCVHILMSSTTSSARVLLAAIVQFSLSTAHVILTFIQILQAFTYDTDANTYYESRGSVFIASWYIYVINTFIQELLLIWRLYNVWGRNFRICIVPLILWAGHVSVATTAVSSFIPTTVTGPKDVLSFGLAGWGLDAATNLTASFGITYRLMTADRRIASLRAQPRLNYKSTTLLIVESGALITTCTVILFGLFASGHEAGNVGSYIAAQISTLAPLLIVARLGLAQTTSRSGTNPGGWLPYPVEIGMGPVSRPRTSDGTGNQHDSPMGDGYNNKVEVMA